MRRTCLNVSCALLIFAIATVSVTQADDSSFERIIHDYKLQLATYSILNTDEPIQLEIPTNNNAQPQIVQDEPPVKMVPVASLNKPASKPEAESKDEPSIKMVPVATLNSPESKPEAEPKDEPSIPADSLNSPANKPEEEPKDDPPVKKLISKNASDKNASDEKTKAESKPETISQDVKPEKVVKQTPAVKNSILENSPKTPENVSSPKKSTSDGWNSVSRKMVSILDTEPAFDSPNPQLSSVQKDSTLPEPQEMFEDKEPEESLAAQDEPSGLNIGTLESIPEPDESLSPVLETETPVVEEPQVELPKADTRMLELVDSDVTETPNPDSASESELANANDYDDNDLNLPEGADKFTYNPFAAAKAPKDTVNNVEVHVLEFESLTPGVTTVKKAVSHWGEPNNKMENKTTSVYQYFRPIKNVASEVQIIFENGKLTTILIQFEQPETIENLEAQYSLSGIKPVVVRKKDGTAAGQAYPERGASFVYAQNSDKQLISRLILEQINMRPFVLRAESNLKDNPTASKADLEYVLNKDPRNAEARWLYGRVLESFGEIDSAIEHLEKAVFLNNNQARYYIDLAAARFDAGLADLADKATDKAIELADRKDAPSPHLVAEAWRIKGDLEANKQNPNFKAALDLHSKAIVLAQQQLANTDPEIAQAALETLVDAHLGAARDIAWGNWNQKASSVIRWLNQANKYNEQIINTAHYSERQIYQSRIRLASKALSAIAGVGREINPVQWAEMLTENGEKLLAMMDSPNEKERLMWNIGMSLYDAVQIFQARKDDEMTLKYGQKAVECLEGASAYANKTAGKVSASDLYIQGRLYFRIGTIYAISRKDHQQAVKWYSKSLPIFEDVADAIPRVELGRLGETLVSMGVSYWEIGKHTQAVNLTQNGIYCLEQAAEEELASQRSLEIPYRNLSMMLNYLGKTQESSLYIKKAEALKTSVR